MSSWASYFDHTLLKQSATDVEIETLCAEAKNHSFFSVCVNPCWVSLCREHLAGTPVKVCTVVGFPLGANQTKIKLAETQQALIDGAGEIDCVLNVGFLKSKKTQLVLEELRQIVHICQNRALVKVIVESGILSRDELLTAIELVNESGAEFIKTSTGFANVGATEEAVQLMKTHGRKNLSIKASGGIKTAADFQKFILLGAQRIGASQSVAILQDLRGSP